jgi:hypothetical protein
MFSYKRKKIKRTIIDKYGISEKEIPQGDNRIQDLSPEEIGSLCNRIFIKTN